MDPLQSTSSYSSSYSSRNRSSLGSSFSFGPQQLADLCLDEANSFPASNPNSRSLDPNSSFLDIFDGSDNEQRGMVDRMRLWRHDALMQHLYATAAFWGDKIVSSTNDPNDAFWLAQTYFMTHQYSRGERLLTRPFPIPPNRPLIPRPAPTTSKGKGPDTLDTPDTPHPTTARLPMGPGGIIEVPEDMQNGVSRLVDMSVACRYLAAQCHMRQGRAAPAIPNLDGGIKIEASMCNLRGIVMLKLNRVSNAKQCFMEALALDVKCVDAFERLVGGEMMTPDEEWEFVQSLPYTSQTPRDASFHTAEHGLAHQRLVEEYGLGDNPDVLFSFAEALYARFRWSDCFAITTRILGLVSIHNPTMLLHIACMYHLSHLSSKLFILACEMVDREPENPISWYAVGVWYLSNSKWAEARQYFSKTSLMDPRFASTWVAFAHTFALEGEHDHAVTAYSTCARMFTGSHLPLLFVGMENIMLSKYALADEALKAAQAICDCDPLLMGELGYEKALALFREALDLAQVTQNSEKLWATTYLNLGTCFRKLKRYQEAQSAYHKALELDPQHPLYHLTDNLDKAIVKYHEALSVDRLNPHVMELLQIALEQTTALLPESLPNIGEFKHSIRSLRDKFCSRQSQPTNLYSCLHN
ncbi:hypothetical protein B0H14DRAFT_2785811 [Mycena olivaceomarginata]|nr:hypothetical protein B0H14DRAFT_2785811 [Mycena olivaceomarginata]